MIEIHKDIKSRLQFFLRENKIPNIIFHGPNGSGKRTLINEFINNIYNNDKKLIQKYVMNVNCAHGKGIKFIRDDLKFFAKTNINTQNNIFFKSIILSNADELTIDAQSALRRCIELFNHTTRFFIIIENKYKLLKPIISRFSDMYIYEPNINNNNVNLYKYNIENIFKNNKDKQSRLTYIKNYIEKYKQLNNKKENHQENHQENRYINLLKSIEYLYEKGYNGIDILNYIEKYELNDIKKYKYLLLFNQIKKEFKNEKLFMLYILNLYIIRSDYDLENISFM